MSGLTFQHLRDRDFGWLADAADGWIVYAATLKDLHGDFLTTVGGAIVGSIWDGKAATLAGEVCDELVQLLDTRHIRATGIAAVLNEAHEDIVDAQRQLRASILKAEKEDLTVTDDGTVTAIATRDDFLADLYEESLSEYLQRARDADAAAAAAVRDLVPGEAGYIQDGERVDIGGDLRVHLKLPMPLEGGSPGENAAWWAGLSPAQKYAYIYDYHAEIGGMDGLPASVRHDANMITLRDDAVQGHDRGQAGKLLDQIEEAQYCREGGDIYLLGYEPPGLDGNPDAKVIAAIGNPDTADHTGIYVPGTGTDLVDMDEQLTRMRNLRNEAVGQSESEVSTIVWLGYDAPDNVGAAGFSGPADDGAPVLWAFTEGLEVSHDDSPTHTTVIGHSYGSTVVGTADALGGQGTDDGLAADDVVALGSPGMGSESFDRQGIIDSPKIDDVSDMHIDPDHMWAGAAADDGVSYIGGATYGVHGNSPVNYTFGGHRFATAGADGHSEYWDPGTASLKNQAYILTGQYDKVEFVARRPG